jgi:hypothetical protein
MNTFVALTLAVAALSPADSTQVYYAAKDTEGLVTLCAETASEELSLLCRYRLFPLTEDEGYLAALPAEQDGTARELALLAGLWGYRAARGPIYLLPRNGGRSVRFLEAALEKDPEEPYALLVEGQSLIFRPGFAGGDRREALARFDRLREVLPRYPESGISPVEVDLWRWYALVKLGDPEAQSLWHDLNARDLPPLYREFLQDPP